MDALSVAIEFIERNNTPSLNNTPNPGFMTTSLLIIKSILNYDGYDEGAKCLEL